MFNLKPYQKIFLSYIHLTNFSFLFVWDSKNSKIRERISPKNINEQIIFYL